MKKYAGVVLVLVLASFVMAPATASAIGLEAAVGYWRQDPSGDLSYKSTDKLDLADEFGFDSENRPYARLKIDLPLFLPNVYLMATPMKFEGTGNRTFDFGNVIFTGAFDSTLELNQYDIGLYYGIPFLKTATLGKLNAEVGLNLKLIDFEATVTGTEQGTGLTRTESESVTLPLPMVYAAVQLKPIKLLAVEVEARGIALSGNHFYDVIGRVKVKPIGPLFIGGGYRYQDVKIDESDVEASLSFKGPFLEAGIDL